MINNYNVQVQTAEKRLIKNTFESKNRFNEQLKPVHRELVKPVVRGSTSNMQQNHVRLVLQQTDRSSFPNSHFSHIFHREHFLLLMNKNIKHRAGYREVTGLFVYHKKKLFSHFLDPIFGIFFLPFLAPKLFKISV